ncbi:MAG: hypothetical protein ACP5O2_00595 [Bacteroidales bacterium]
MWIKLLLTFIASVFIQLAVFDNLNLGAYFNPLVYTLFILKLPFRTQNWALLLWAFALGLLLDFFQSSHGLNAAACVLMAFTRPFVIKWLTTRRDFSEQEMPSIRDMGVQWYILYSIILLFIHHFGVFILEEGSISGLFAIFIRALLSTGFAFGLILIAEYLFFLKKS